MNIFASQISSLQSSNQRREVESVPIEVRRKPKSPTIPDEEILAKIADIGPATEKEIISGLTVERTTIYNILRRLEFEGHLIRKHSSTYRRTPIIWDVKR